jgi:hypothetical protein
MPELRKDETTARKIDFALVCQKVSGTDSARDYLRAVGMPEPMIDRVLSEQDARAEFTPAPAPADETQRPPNFYCTPGRRRDVLAAAVVQAAISVRDTLGVDRAERLLRREGLPLPVIARVIGADAQVLRVRVDRPP